MSSLRLSAYYIYLVPRSSQADIQSTMVVTEVNPVATRWEHQPLMPPTLPKEPLVAG